MTIFNYLTHPSSGMRLHCPDIPDIKFPCDITTPVLNVNHKRKLNEHMHNQLTILISNNFNIILILYWNAVKMHSIHMPQMLRCYF